MGPAERDEVQVIFEVHCKAAALGALGAGKRSGGFWPRLPNRRITLGMEQEPFEVLREVEAAVGPAAESKPGPAVLTPDSDITTDSPILQIGDLELAEQFFARGL